MIFIVNIRPVDTGRTERWLCYNFIMSLSWYSWIYKQSPYPFLASRKRKSKLTFLISLNLSSNTIHNNGCEMQAVSCCYGTAADSLTPYFHQPATCMGFREWLACAGSKGVCCQYILPAEKTAGK